MHRVQVVDPLGGLAKVLVEGIGRDARQAPRLRVCQAVHERAVAQFHGDDQHLITPPDPRDAGQVRMVDVLHELKRLQLDLADRLAQWE